MINIVNLVWNINSDLILERKILNNCICNGFVFLKLNAIKKILNIN